MKVICKTCGSVQSDAYFGLTCICCCNLCEPEEVEIKNAHGGLVDLPFGVEVADERKN